MALIECPGCGMKISDKALKCPGCGYENNLQDLKINKLLCGECGNELGESDEVCTVCGCPVNVEANEKPQKVEVASINIPKLSKKKKNILITAVALVVIIFIGIVAGVLISNKNSKAKYQENLSLAAQTMLSGAAQAEKSGGLIHDVWYNTIYKKQDTKTDKYTKNSNGTFNDDFNTSIRNLRDDESFINDINYIKNNQEATNNIMKKLVNPPEEFEEAYDKLQELYDSYLELTNLAVNPTGTLSTYTSDFNDADSAVANAYKTMQRYMD